MAAMFSNSEKKKIIVHCWCPSFFLTSFSLSILIFFIFCSKVASWPLGGVEGVVGEEVEVSGASIGHSATMSLINVSRALFMLVGSLNRYFLYLKDYELKRCA